MHPDQPHPGDLPIPEELTLDDTTPADEGPPPDTHGACWQDLNGHTWTIRPGHVLDATTCEVYDLTDLRGLLQQRAVALHRQAVAEERSTPSLLVWLHHELNVPRAEALAPTTWLDATPLMRLINQRLARWQDSAFDGPSN